MTVDCFNAFCVKIRDQIGKETFRTEAYLIENSTASSIPAIAGEIKVALSLRTLAGGSYFDLVPLFAVSTAALYKIFLKFLERVLLTFEFSLVGWLRGNNWEVLKHLALQFAERGNGVLCGPFAAIDGIAIKVKCPTFNEVPDPGNYYCRKGFCALNVKAMCDKTKRFLWCYPSNKGSTHDSSAFSVSQLSAML